jgi:hypothetical protein
MLTVIMLCVSFSYCYANCHYAECRYAECRYAEYCGALSAIMSSVIKLPGALICTWV